MSRAIDDLEIGPSVRSFYSVVLDVQMFVVPHIITSETYLSYFLGTLNTLNSSNLIIKYLNKV